MTRLLLFAAFCLALLGTVACAHPAALSNAEQARLATLWPTDLLLVGEQHDAPEHQRLQRQLVDWLASRGQLAALTLEMAERGQSSAGLPRDADEAAVRRALAWDDAGWPWASYGPVVMAAVRAGVPVLGANLPRGELRAAMADASLDARVPAAALAEQRQRMRDGHCGLLPEGQITPMARVQIARDIAMAEVAAGARQPSRTVLLVAGNGHVERSLGVPLHLPADLSFKVLSARAGQTQTAIDSGANDARPQAATDGADLVWPTPPVPPRDYCAELGRTAPAAPPATPQ